MSRLHTFLICRTPQAEEEEDEYEEDGSVTVEVQDPLLRKKREEDCLKTFSRYTAVLRRVVLTPDWEWMKSLVFHLADLRPDQAPAAHRQGCPPAWYSGCNAYAR